MELLYNIWAFFDFLFILKMKKSGGNSRSLEKSKATGIYGNKNQFIIVLTTDRCSRFF